ncbi:hypothetical protein ACT17_06300 [Mycolicibacterium conceptionense]|uniref:Uncharacterized protein n=1 Tax=Mycolicibacterium conceptionense TaxID=451644 RepID=A0A0J8UEA6_9MYCO|nr:hypothetical protein [Mycolicibacterium conceptionense]KMV19646.1 hypothetical protein ACT17_06300 [Mycolicibacterium conceptionense]
MSLINSNWNDSIDSIRNTSRYSAAEIGEDQLPGAYLETDGDDLVVGAVEYLHFANERGDLEGLTDDGWLTDSGLRKAEETMKKLLKDAGVPGADTLSVSDQTGGDDPHVDFSIAIPADSNASVGQVVDQVVHPFCAVVQNVTDPGTFGSPYLWSEVSR